ncbi:hypothetical protein H3V28_gp70, partial [Escherichia phage 4A7]
FGGARESLRLPAFNRPRVHVENFGKPLFINLHENNPLSNTRPDMKTPEKGIFGHFHVGPLRMQY